MFFVQLILPILQGDTKTHGHINTGNTGTVGGEVDVEGVEAWEREREGGGL